MEQFSDDAIIVPREASEDNSPVTVAVPARYSNGHQLSIPVASNHKFHTAKTVKKPTSFNRAFKQAVFQKRGKEDGSSNLHVTFTSSMAKSAGVATGKVIHGREQLEVRTVTKPAAVVHSKSKAKPAPYMYKDIVTIDKKKMQEEIESIPKPDHLLDAEKELLSYEGIKTFSETIEDEKVYPCVGCLDVYPSQFSLNDHLNRQSYQLILECPECMKRCAFTNKCRMYEHLYNEHSVDKIRAGQIVSSAASLQVLPRAQIKPASNNTAVAESDVNGGTDGGHCDGVKMEVNDVEENTMANGEKPTELLEAGQSDHRGDKGTVANMDQSWVNNSDDTKQELVEEPVIECEDEDEIDTSISCTECSRTFETEWTLQTHFSLPAEASFESEICIPCKVQLVTPCALKAHMRVHSLTEPFVCPDCGQRMYKKNVFLKHIRLHCLHYSILSEFACPGCPEAFGAAEEQLNHLKSNPSHLRFEGERSYYKCNGCPKAFKSVAAHSKHESCPGAGCTVVHMCNNCPQQTVFRSWSELTEHRSQAHPQLVWKPKRSKIFSCYLCAHKSRTKQGLLDHLLKVHSKKKIDHMCEFCGVEADGRQSLESHREACAFKDEAKGRVKAPLAIAERKPKLSSSSSVISDVSSNNDTPADNPELVLTASPTTTAGQTQRTHRSMSYLAHTPSFNCHMCTAQFSNYNKLREHVTKRHEGRGLIYECWLCRDKGSTANFYRQSALDKHMADVHKLQIFSPETQTPDVRAAGEADQVSEEEEVPTKRMKIWSEEGQPYQCCRCDYTSLAVGDFKDHIKTHKSTMESHQCAECGMCFIVQLALRRHLFAVHKVADYAKYSRSQYMADYERQLQDTQGKCPVCQQQFDEDLKLRKHLRTHGMMYINTRRVVPS